MRPSIRLALGLALFASTGACAERAAGPVRLAPAAVRNAAPSAAPVARRPLRVALFPYIPDSNHDHFKSFVGTIESEFEKQNPEVDLTLRPLDPTDERKPFFTPSTVVSWLTATSGDAYDVVEVDMEMLDQLTGGAAEPWSDLREAVDDWHPAAAAAVSAGGRIWAYPHWVCGHFVFTRDEAVARAKTEPSLVAAVNATPSRRLVGDFGGSWNLPSLFLDAYADTYGAEHVASGLKAPLDTSALASLTRIAHLCAPPSSDDCTDTFHRHPEEAIATFARGDAAAYLGFSEALHDVLSTRADSAPLYVISAPIGGGSHPVLFTDGLVLRKGCAADCQRDARSFADFLTGPRMSEALLLSKDGGAGAKPRYLLPASKSALGLPAVAADRYYPALGQLIAAGVNFPNSGFVAAKSKMQSELVDALKRGQRSQR